MGVLPSVDLTNIDLTDLDLSRTTAVVRRLTELSGELARDAAYTTVGLGLLTFQRAQVLRREVERALRR